MYQQDKIKCFFFLIATKGKCAAISPSHPTLGRLGRSAVDTLNMSADTFWMFSNYLNYKIIIQWLAFLTSPIN